MELFSDLKKKIILDLSILLKIALTSLYSVLLSLPYINSMEAIDGLS